MSDLRPVPTLDQLTDEPERAQALSAPAAFGLLSRCLTAQATLLARLGGALNECAAPAAESASDGARWLPVDAAAAIMGVDPRWLRRSWKRLPFAHRISRKNLVFDEVRLRRWLAARHGT
jgi:hypothetical protein